jgi:GTP-binding protein EngB required for normal cell division
VNPIPARLADVVGRFLGKVEIVLAGADEDLRAGQEALAAGDAMAARAAAHRVLDQAPGSPLALALLADACDAAHLDAELALTLEELARRAPGRAEVWLRLARARAATGATPDEVGDAFARALAAAESGSDERFAALLGLADLDLARGDGARAELWLERAAPGLAAAPTTDEELALRAAVSTRRAEARLLRGDPDGAKASLDAVAADPLDGRVALVRGRVLAALGDAAAFAPLVRAFVLDMPRASEALAAALASVPTDAQTRTRVRSVVDARGEQDQARWRAAFARAEGARDAARTALRDAVEGGDVAAARPLLDAAIDDRDAGALEAALRALSGAPASALVDDARLVAGALHAAIERGADVLDAAASVTHPRFVTWAESLVASVADAWIPRDLAATTAWPAVLARLNLRAHDAGNVAAAAAVDDLAAERSRPVRLAIVGEFNAGKSTFINALIGADVAPTGVLPTTATLHHLRWAPDPFAKILFVPGVEPAERIVPLGDLRAALATLAAPTIRRVELRMPLPSLVDVEILDTPGYNAPDPRHAELAGAAFDECDAAFWLVDAAQPMKQSERAVLARAARAGVPVQVLVNKADRLAPADVGRVLQVVAEAIAGASVDAVGPPVAFSARKALAARVGAAGGGVDAGALADANWPAVERLLHDAIVGRSAELKERALRRRAAQVLQGLAHTWTERAASEEAEARRHAARAHDAALAAARLDRDGASIADGLAASLEGPARAWESDVARLFAGRDRSAAYDPALARYRVDRAVAAIAPALSRAMAALAPEAGVTPDDVAPAARAIVRAATASARAAGAPTLALLLDAAASAAVDTLAERLGATAVAPPPAGRAAGVLRELAAFAAALRRPAAVS